MSLFHLHYECHPGALAMRKSDGVVFNVVRNVSMWDMTAILVPNENIDPNEEVHSFEDVGMILVESKQFKEDFLVLDEGKDRLSEALKKGLSQLVK